MILTNELRLGNWVDYNDYPSNGFTRLNEHLMTCVFSDENWINHFISPIPLTEEILLKCGFNIFANRAVQYECIILIYEGKFRYKNSNIDIKYLHQLQNLYFALTNQELNIEL